MRRFNTADPLIAEPEFLMFAEGDEGGEGGGEAEAAKAEVEKGETENGDFDWRSLITDEAAKKEAERTTDLNAAFKRISDMRGEMSGMIRLPGKDADEKQVAAFRNAMDIPEDADGYEWQVPEGYEVTDADREFQQTAAAMFHELGVTRTQAAGLNEFWNELQTKAHEAEVAADKEFADASMDALRRKWPGDEEFKRNKAFADRAAERMFGESMDEVRKLQTRDGRFVLDHAPIIAGLAAIGREMQEGGIGTTLTETDSAALESQIEEVQKKIDEAQAKGNHKRANELYQQKLGLIERKTGTTPIVGAGRAA